MKKLTIVMVMGLVVIFVCLSLSGCGKSSFNPISPPEPPGPPAPFESWDGTIAFRFFAYAFDYNSSRLFFITPLEQKMITDKACPSGSIRWSPDGEYLAYRDWLYHLVMVSKNGVSVIVFPYTTGWAGSQISWSNDSQYVLSAMLFSGIYRYSIDGSSQKLLDSAYNTNDHNPVQSRDGRWIYFLHNEFGVQPAIYRIETEKLLSGASYADCEEVAKITISSMTLDESVQLEPTNDGKVIIAYDSTLSLVDPQTKTIKEIMAVPFSFIRLSPNGRYLAAAPYQSGVAIFDTSSWKMLTTIKSGNFWLQTFAWHPDSQALAIGGVDYDTSLNYNVARAFIWRFSDPRLQKIFEMKVDQLKSRFAYGEQTASISWAE